MPEKCSSGCLRHHPVTGQWVGRCLLPTKGQVGVLHNGRDALLRCTGGNACGDKRWPEGELPLGQVRRGARRGRRPAVERSRTNALGVRRPVSAAAPRCKAPAGRGLSARATGGEELPCDIAPSVSATRATSLAEGGKGKRIPTPVRALARNDRGTGRTESSAPTMCNRGPSVDKSVRSTAADTFIYKCGWVKAYL